MALKYLCCRGVVKVQRLLVLVEKLDLDQNGKV